ncbi:MAG: phosphoribosylformylglycinamidine synthase II, partial [Rhodospirillales bacterium]|nr:phosphoribosylformylglycinamidine synthase II [Rhodospirillales bacterium]
IGHITDTGRIVVKHKGAVEADILLAPLADEAPLYRRPIAETPKPAKLAPISSHAPLDQALTKLIGSPDLCSRRWIFDQYDSTVGGQTVKRPAQADAAIVRLENSKRALAITTDVTPRYCVADAEVGGAQAVAEAWRNITATGAKPLAITDNMNFGNPEKPEIMGQFASAIKGMAAACKALDFPVVSGNVSLYNETEGKPILPTPAIGAVGVLEDAAKAVGYGLKPGLSLVVVGETKGELGRSLYLRELLGREDGAPPPVDLAAERRNGDFVRDRILNHEVEACHDVSDGGLLVAVAEMAMAGDCGVELTGAGAAEYWFGEDQARYVLAVKDSSALIAAASTKGIPAQHIGRSSDEKKLTLPDGLAISLVQLRDTHEGFFLHWFA